MPDLFGIAIGQYRHDRPGDFVVPGGVFFGRLSPPTASRPRCPRSIRSFPWALGALVAVILAVTGVAGESDLGLRQVIGASFGPVCGAMLADYLLAGRKWSGPRAGFNPAGWISWIVGFAVGAFNLVECCCVGVAMRSRTGRLAELCSRAAGGRDGRGLRVVPAAVAFGRPHEDPGNADRGRLTGRVGQAQRGPTDSLSRPDARMVPQEPTGQNPVGFFSAKSLPPANSSLRTSRHFRQSRQEYHAAVAGMASCPRFAVKPPPKAPILDKAAVAAALAEKRS